MKRYYIIEGDVTSVGGVVQRHTGSAQTTTVYDKIVSNIGDKINCSACGSVGTIKAVGHRQPFGNHSNIPAMQEDICVCNCSPPPVLKHSQELFYQEDESWFGVGETINSLSSLLGSTVSKEKEVRRIFWTYGDDFTPLETKSRFFDDLNLHIETVGYQTGESISVEISSDVTDFDAFENFNISLTIDGNGNGIFQNVFQGRTIAINTEY